MQIGASWARPLVERRSAPRDDPAGADVSADSGNLSGTTALGGTGNAGTVFETAKTSMGYAGKPIIVASFTGADGECPLGSPTTDAAGDLFGATGNGGADGAGTVFEIAAAKSGAGAPATAAFVQAMASHGSNALASTSVSTTVWRDDPRTLLARPPVA